MADTNGVNGQHVAGQTISLDLATVVQALEVIHNPASQNDHRHQATAYLEDLKNQNGVAEAGFALSNDISQQPLVRYYGLSLLEHVVKRQSFALNEDSSVELRQLILRLSLTLNDSPQSFIRNKIGALWVDLAKRSWALDWFELDSTLQELWARSDVEKEFVLTILENLSDDVFVREDATSVLRARDLNDAVVEIFTSAANYTGGLKIGGTIYHMRQGEDGWALRITSFLNDHLHSGKDDGAARRLSVSALGVLRSLFSWLMTPAIVSANSMSVVCDALTQAGTEMVLPAIDTLLAFYSRRSLEVVDVQALVHPLCHPSSVGVLEQVFTWSIVGPDDILDARYGISKKLAELLYHIASWLTSANPPEDTDLVPFLKLLVKVAGHESLIVSIAAVHAWHKILDSNPAWRRLPAVEACLQDILQVAMQRIIAYDMLSPEEDNAAVQFVNEEIELYPERQGFYLNYRRLCFSVIESISTTYLQDSLGFILQEVDSRFEKVFAADQAADASKYQRLSTTMLEADALFSVIDATFKGISKFTNAHDRGGSEEMMRQSDELLQQCKQWTSNMLARFHFKDPGTTLRQIKTVVEISSRILKKDTEFAFVTLQFIISALHTPPTTNASLSDSYAELHQFAIQELRRLCSEHATYFITFYDQLEEKLSEIMSSSIEVRYQVDLKATMMLLIEHAKGIDNNLRLDRLRTFVTPLQEAWDRQESSLGEFNAFTKSQAFDQVGPFMSQIAAMKQVDWTEVPLPAEAQAIQQSMADGASRLPLRETRVLLSMSMDRVSSDSQLHGLVCELWMPFVHTIVRNALRLISYNHLLHDPSAWPNISEDQRIVVQRILRDRYWQSGISGGSMQDFHHRVKATKSTLEGFASSVRGRIRTNLENCYSIIHNLGKLGSQFYSMQELPNMASNALFATSNNLSPHHFGILLSMMPKLIEECPDRDRQHFLTPILADLTSQMDMKCTAEWEKLSARANGVNHQQIEGELSDEMRDESVLRQMTSRAVNIVTGWLDSSRDSKLSSTRRISNKSGHNLRSFVLGNRTILEPLLMFCCHSITYKDTKTCSTMVMALQKLVPAFSTEIHLQGHEAMAVREFISEHMLKAAINSLNDGYFADYHGHLAVLIALIWLSYGLPAHVPATDEQPAHDRPAWTQTPQNILMSIPGLQTANVEHAGRQLSELGLAGRQKTMRAIVLNLLEGVRGVRVSELGKYDNKQEKSGLLEKYKQRDALGIQGMDETGMRNGEEGPDLGGVADMFG